VKLGQVDFEICEEIDMDTDIQGAKQLARKRDRGCLVSITVALWLFGTIPQDR